MKSKWYGEDTRIGILGGGQLGRMLLQEAINLNIHLHCLDPDENAPCSKIAHSFTVGSLTDYETVLAFGKDKDLISVEIENVNIEALKALEKQGVAVFPQAHILELIQDKGLQKQFYLENNIPTAPFELIENKADLLAKIHFPADGYYPKGDPD
jgi:5-(carboxyamino)imidazole ribonucleotide synthase